MSNEYPKALYKGSQTEPEMITVDGLGQEQGKREAGYVDFTNLPERESRVASGSVAEVSAKANPEVDSLKVELLEALKAKKEIEENFVGFRNDVQAMKARIADIKDIPMDADQSTGETQGTGQTTDYSALSISELQSLLKERNIKFKVNDTKPVLIGLLGGNDEPKDNS